jgi:hypothetical protein
MSEKKEALRDFPIDLPQYVHLRTMLDSVVAGVLRFYLNATTRAEQEQRFKYLETHLMNISDHVFDRKPEDDDPCPPGYHNCNGCCVPYECVFGGDPKPHK